MLKLFKTFLKSTTVGAISILIFSPYCYAVSLRKSSGTFPNVVGIDGLEIGNETYNVDFRWGSYDSVYSNIQPLFLDNEEGANLAAKAIMEALGERQRTFRFLDRWDWKVKSSDNFQIPYLKGSIRGIDLVSVVGEKNYSALSDDRLLEGARWVPEDRYITAPWAVFVGKGSVGTANMKSTLEPSLMLGFITVGGFMLGSRKKEKA